MTLSIDLDVTKHKNGFSVLDWGDGHRILIGDAQISLTAEQLKELNAEIHDYIEECL